MKKRIVSLLLVLTMVIGMIPLAASASTPETVYISVSDDAQYVPDASGAPVAYTAVTLEELESVNLDDYGLGDYWYDADGDGTPEITALHLYIYTHENLLGLNFSDVYITGSAGSLYFANGLFGFVDENLRYDYNGAYPAVDGWGLTADQIVLSDGDFLNVAHYTSWAFWGDSATGFHYFADENGAIVQHFAARAQEALTIKLVRAAADIVTGSGTANYDEPYYEVFYGTSYGTPIGSATTDDYGCATITFPSAGTWYVWADGGCGMENPGDIVSAPAFAVVTVKEDADKAAANTVIGKINAIGTVTLDKEAVVQEARMAYNALTDAQKALVSNYSTLTAAESTLEQLKEEAEQEAADQAAADAAEDKITAIGTVTVFSGSKISQARTAYDALTDTQRALVENAAVLTAAESTLAQLYQQAANSDPETVYEETGKYIAGLGTPSVGSTGGEWMVIDLVRAGQACPEGYYRNVVDYVTAKINDKEQLHRAKGTDNSRVILALTAAGYDVTDVAGHNLLMGLTDMTYVKKQGINGPIWALIAFDSHHYEIPTNPDAAEQVTREKLIAYILEKQLDDGGWALSGTVADPDMTGMAIQSLAPYYGTSTEVKAAVDEALACLSAKQHANGGFGSIDGVCTESCAQVIVALTTLGIDPETDPRFVKNGISVLDAMCLFAVEGGGFVHVPGGSLNGMATEQSQYALAAYFRFKNGQTSLYDMSDVVLPGEAVAQKIAQIGTVTLDSEKTITESRTAYDALSDYQKTLVSNYKMLTDAEATLAALDQEKPENSPEPTTPKTGDGTDPALLISIMVISLCGLVALAVIPKRRLF